MKATLGFETRRTEHQVVNLVLDYAEAVRLCLAIDGLPLDKVALFELGNELGAAVATGRNPW